MVIKPENWRLLVIGETSPLHSLWDLGKSDYRFGVRRKRPEKWLRVLSSQLSPVRFAEELCEIPADFACFGNGTAEFLYRSDCVAGRGEFELAVQF